MDQWRADHLRPGQQYAACGGEGGRLLPLQHRVGAHALIAGEVAKAAARVAPNQARTTQFTQFAQVRVAATSRSAMPVEDLRGAGPEIRRCGGRLPASRIRMPRIDLRATMKGLP